MRKHLLLCTIWLSFLVLTACGTNRDTSTIEQQKETSISDTTDSEETTTPKHTDNSSDYSYHSQSNDTYEHTCEADGCYKEGTKTLVGFSGELEYYCITHYNEIQDMISDMEEDVGNGSASKHTCEVSGCSKEGTNEITGVSGTSEYYCTEHYNEMMEMLGNMLEDN